MPKLRGKLTKERTLEKLRKESSFLQRMQVCPAVVRFIDRFEEQDEVHLVTELCRGGDMKSLVEVRCLVLALDSRVQPRTS